MVYNFAQPFWKEQLITAYSYRFTEAPEFTQETDHIKTCVNRQHREGFDNISLLTSEKFSFGAEVSLLCSFEGLGCPEIILVPQIETCSDGNIRYGACFETVLWKNGINVWRHFRENGSCFWHKRLGLTFPVAERSQHLLKVKILEDYLHITMDDLQVQLRTEDLPEDFHLGLTGCEGIVRLYNMEIR